MPKINIALAIDLEILDVRNISFDLQTIAKECTSKDHESRLAVIASLFANQIEELSKISDEVRKAGTL